MSMTGSTVKHSLTPHMTATLITPDAGKCHRCEIVSSAKQAAPPNGATMNAMTVRISRVLARIGS